MSRDARARWNTRHENATESRLPSLFLLTLAEQLPRAGRALDVAGGTGRHAHWLNERGWEVTLVDVSDTALERAGDAVRCIRRDLEADGLPGGSWDLILVVDFLWRPLFAQFVDALPAGGWLVVEHPTRRNLERNPHPSAHFLLGDGELPDLVPELEILLYEEGWFDGRHVARLVATASL